MFHLIFIRLIPTSRILSTSPKVISNHCGKFLRTLSSQSNDHVQSSKIPLANINQEDVGKRMGIQFRCKICDHTLRKTFTRQSYERGVVIIRCDSCQNLHLVADNLGWFKDLTQNGKFKNVAQMLQAKGETIHRVTVPPIEDTSRLTEEGIIEKLPSNESANK